MIIKVIASGLILGSHTYFHSGWNIMDGSLVLVSIIDLTTMHRGSLISSNVESDATTRIFSMLRVFRLLRTLRPLRGWQNKRGILFCFWKISFRSSIVFIFSSFQVISRAPGLKLVVQTLLSSLRPIGHIVVICCTFFIVKPSFIVLV